jgi:glycerol-1-phosphate dehydrogenase [NAD(P)+]
MSFFDKIGIKQKCGCGREHLCPIDYIKISEGAIDELSHIAKKYTKILVVADENTYAVAGDKAIKALSGKNAEKMIFGSELLVPNEDAINKIEKKLTSDVELVVGIGSGVINDLCKYTSFRANIPYVIVATAPSMDGYASVGCALILDGLKVTLNGRVPMAILADTEVLVTAPLDMILSGYGDIIGKYSCLSDWRLSALVNGEYLCEDVWQATMREVEKTCALSDKITLKDKAAVGSLMESLVAVGVLMAYVGNSRPASGSEHIVAHAWELYDIEHGNHPHLHGLEVCEGTRLVAIMYKMLYEETNDAHLKELIEKYIPYFDAVEEFCVKMKMPPTVTDRQIIIDGIKRALIMRDRYTILFYLRDCGKFEEYAEKAADKLLEVI